ncbi:uncharacterized protein VTP21DRAFT_9917 [Calcarisporiella thermophila]|uniref:uncharacterized protein n=1 Tax=Calcarisporiella thermophila TaxID=911321 RepID=UPI0037442488
MDLSHELGYDYTTGYCEVKYDHKAGKKTHELYYEIHGKGPKRLMLVQGLSLPGRFWHYVIREYLKKGDYSILIFDNRGVGRSGVPLRWWYSTKSMAKDALKLLDFVGWTSDVHLVGTSMGGMIAQWMAAYRPDYFLSLTLTSTTSGRLIPPTLTDIFGVPWTGIAITHETRSQRIANICFPKDFMRLPSDANGCESMRDEIEKAYTHFYEISDRQRLFGNARQMIGVVLHYLPMKMSDRIVDSGIPVMVFHGTEDRLIPAWRGEILAKRLRARFQIFKGGGHQLMDQFPDKYCELIEKNIRESEIKAADFLTPIKERGLNEIEKGLVSVVVDHPRAERRPVRGYGDKAEYVSDEEDLKITSQHVEYAARNPPPAAVPVGA